MFIVRPYEVNVYVQRIVEYSIKDKKNTLKKCRKTRGRVPTTASESKEHHRQQLHTEFHVVVYPLTFYLKDWRS